MLGRLIFLAYTLAAPVIAALYIFSLLFTQRRGRIVQLASELKERLGISLPSGLAPGGIWVHAASIGEVKAISSLALVLSKQLGKDFFITTSTLNGKKEALKLTKRAYLLPIDFYPCIKRFIDKTKPKLLINTETEIWPSAFSIAAKKGVAIYIVNARLSARTYKLYAYMPAFSAYIFKGVRKVLCQSECYAKRYSKLKGLKGKVQITGNLKYDQLPKAIKTKEAAQIISHFTSPPPAQKKSALLFIAGCTHAKEEPILLNAYCSYLKHSGKECGLKLILAPRHLEQLKKTLLSIKNANLSYAVWPDMPLSKTANKSVLVINKTGILQDLYKYSDICFVGGTFDNTGGHNILEPALYEKPVIFGPNYKNSKLAASALLENKGGFLVYNSADLSLVLKKLCLFPSARKKAGLNAKLALIKLKGAKLRTLNIIQSDFKTLTS